MRLLGCFRGRHAISNATGQRLADSSPPQRRTLNLRRVQEHKRNAVALADRARWQREGGWLIHEQLLRREQAHALALLCSCAKGRPGRGRSIWQAILPATVIWLVT